MALPRSGGFLSVTINSKKVENMLTGYEKTLPEAADIGLKKLAGKYAEIYLEQLPKAGIEPWTGRSFNILRRQIKDPQKIGRNAYGVIVPANLVSLDQMNDHWVSFRRSPSLAAWAKTKLGLSGLEGRIAGGLFVLRHPWVANANRRAARHIKIVRKEIHKAVRRKGK